MVRYLSFLFFLGLTGLFIIGISWQWFQTLHTYEIMTVMSDVLVSPQRDLTVRLAEIKSKPERRTVKGLYLTAYSAGTEAKLEQIIDLIDRTELNAMVIDIKDYTGWIRYDSEIALVNELRTEKDQLGNVRSLIKKLHEHDIYVIARQTVFQDPILAQKKPEWAIQKKGGGIWRDHKGLSWVDPTNKAVWQYNLVIAKEAIRLGFDEINFDYIRFPSDGDMTQVVYTNGDKKRYEVMRDFFHYLNTELSDEPVWLSVDLFGFVMERGGEDDLKIGQRLVDAADEVDYISPMMYPSHYPAGQLGLENPADYPAQVIEYGMNKGLPTFTNKRAKLRPWLQAFSLGAVYDGQKIREQIEVTEKYTEAGWLLWNASNRYSEAGLQKGD